MDLIRKLFGKPKRSKFLCETCGAPLICRTSWFEHIFMRRELYQCDFAPCSASYWGRTELTHVAARSGIPGAPLSKLPPQSQHLVDMAAQVYLYNQQLAAQQKTEQQLDLLDGPQEEQQPVKEDLAS